MLSKLIVTNQKFVFILDKLNRERIALNFMAKLLQEQGEEEPIRSLPVGSELKHVCTFEALLKECSNSSSSTDTSQSDTPTAKPHYNVVLPTLGDLLCYQSPAFIFSFINKLRRTEYVRRVLLWASPQHVVHADVDYILAGCEYMAELVMRLEEDSTITMISRKPGGSVTNRRYNCQVSKNEFLVTLMSEETKATAATSKKEPSPAADPGGTFKIELDEDEVVARNALTLPYERAKQAAEGNIIYHPDEDEDYDAEDPDDDLVI